LGKKKKMKIIITLILINIYLLTSIKEETIKETINCYEKPETTCTKDGDEVMIIKIQDYKKRNWKKDFEKFKYNQKAMNQVKINEEIMMKAEDYKKYHELIKKKEYKKYVITGNFMNGLIAQIITYQIIGSDNELKEKLFCITFGSPSIGKK
jgi:hypothetical protein